VCLYVGVDALVESPEEALEAIAEDFQGPLDSGRIQSALRWFDPDHVPVEVSARGQTRVYGNGAADSLQRDAERALAPMMGDSLRALRSHVEVEDDEGAIQLQLLTSRGMANVDLRLRFRSDAWKVYRVQVTR
jgi:hypothetical protein